MTKNEAALWMTVDAIDDAIKESGTQGIPAGHLYAAIMGQMNLETFNAIISLLKKGKKIKETNHLLTAI